MISKPDSETAVKFAAELNQFLLTDTIKLSDKKTGPATAVACHRGKNKVDFELCRYQIQLNFMMKI